MNSSVFGILEFPDFRNYMLLIFGVWTMKYGTNTPRLASFLRVPRLVIEGKIVSEGKTSNWTLMMKHRGQMDHKSPSLVHLSVHCKQL